MSTTTRQPLASRTRRPPPSFGASIRGRSVRRIAGCRTTCRLPAIRFSYDEAFLCQSRWSISPELICEGLDKEREILVAHASCSVIPSEPTKEVYQQRPPAIQKHGGMNVCKKIACDFPVKFDSGKIFLELIHRNRIYRIIASLPVRKYG